LWQLATEACLPLCEGASSLPLPQELTLVLSSPSINSPTLHQIKQNPASFSRDRPWQPLLRPRYARPRALFPRDSPRLRVALSCSRSGGLQVALSAPAGSDRGVRSSAVKVRVSMPSALKFCSLFFFVGRILCDSVGSGFVDE
jgi:hypothetical protein